MKTRLVSLLALILMISLAILACNFPAPTPTISEVWMARDYLGEIPTTVFSPEEIFYCIARLQNSPVDSVVRAEWTVIEAEGVELDQLIDQIELRTQSSILHFELTNAGPWPAGAYKVDLYLNGELDRTLEFTVQ